MRVLDVRSLMRLMLGVAAFVQAVDMAILFRVVFEEGKMQLPFFDWLPVIPQSLAPLYIGVWCLAAVAFAAGRKTRLAGVVLIFSMMYAILVDQQTYSNHVYLLVIVILLLLIPGSIPVALLRWQMSIVYFFAAISKVNLIYISGVILAANFKHGWLVQLPEALFRWEIMLPIAMSSICLEIFLAVALWIPRYRRVALALGPSFHLAIVLLFPVEVVLQLIVFGLTMGSLYLLFLDPVTVEKWTRSTISRARRMVPAPVSS